jgi:hypothetical protein
MERGGPRSTRNCCNRYGSVAATSQHAGEPERVELTAEVGLEKIVALSAITLGETPAALVAYEALCRRFSRARIWATTQTNGACRGLEGDGNTLVLGT